MGRRKFSTRRINLVVISLVLWGFIAGTSAIASASPTNVRFDIRQGSIFAHFSVECIPSDTQLQLTPGSSRTISFSVSSAPGEVGVEVLGHTASRRFDTPIGTLSIPVFTVYVADVNVDITGRLAGTINISGPGLVNTQTLNWSGWGTRSLTLTVSSDAKTGETVEVTLYLTYTVDIGASASIPIVGRQTIGSITAARLSGSPPITVTVFVVQPKVSLELLPIVFGILIVAVIIIAVVIWWNKFHRWTSKGESILYR